MITVRFPILGISPVAAACHLCFDSPYPPQPIETEKFYKEYQLDCYIKVPDDKQYEEVIASLTNDIAKIHAL